MRHPSYMFLSYLFQSRLIKILLKLYQYAYDKPTDNVHKWARNLIVELKVIDLSELTDL